MSLLADSGWAVFLSRWRAIVLGGLLLGCAATGWGGALGRYAPIGAAVGALVAVTGHPLTGHALALGQANLLIVGMMGAATWAAARDRVGLAAALATLGAAVKLVPGLALWPLLAARRWRALGVAAVVGMATLAVTLARIPAAGVLSNLIDTLRFQQGVTPAWFSILPGPFLPFLGVLRIGPLGTITLVAMAVCAHGARNRPEQPAVLAAGIALGTAWLGAAASAVGVFYGLLLLPALIRLSVWPLAERAPRVSWILAPVALLLPRLVVTADDTTMLASFEMFCVGLVIWGMALLQLLHAAWPALGRREGGIILVTALLSVGFAVVRVATSPGFPAAQPGIGQEQVLSRDPGIPGAAGGAGSQGPANPGGPGHGRPGGSGPNVGPLPPPR